MGEQSLLSEVLTRNEKEIQIFSIWFCVTNVKSTVYTGLGEQNVGIWSLPYLFRQENASSVVLETFWKVWKTFDISNFTRLKIVDIAPVGDPLIMTSEGNFSSSSTLFRSRKSVQGNGNRSRFFGHACH